MSSDWHCQNPSTTAISASASSSADECRYKGADRHACIEMVARLLCHDLHSAWRSFGGGFNIFQIVIWSMPRKPA